MEKKRLYWLCQFSGWGLLAGGNLINASAGGNVVPETVFFTLALFFIPFIISHAYRWIIHEVGIRYWNPLKLVPLTLLSSVIMIASLFYEYILLWESISFVTFLNVYISKSAVCSELFISPASES